MSIGRRSRSVKSFRDNEVKYWWPKGCQETRTLERTRSTVFGPIPGTPTRSSTRLNGPLSLRYLRIAAALDGPIPGRSVSSSCDARFKSIDCGRGIAPETARPENVTWRVSARRADGPIPGTRSRTSSEPNGPSAVRFSTILLARAGPIRGNRNNSSAVARSTSIRSLAPRGRERRSARPPTESRLGRCSLPARYPTAPGATDPCARYRTPAPARATHNNNVAARRSLDEGMANVH
jgi:hypothetical protein